MTTMLRLYDYLPSGNGYKVRLLCQLGIEFERVSAQPGHVRITDPVGTPVRWQ